MLKIILIVLCVSCRSSSGMEISELRIFGEKVRNLSLELLYYTEQENDGQIAMAPFTVWNLFSIFAFETSDANWKEMHTTIGIPKREGQYINSLFAYVTNLLRHLSPGAMFRSRQVVFYDKSLKLSQHFQRTIKNSGAVMKKMPFRNNVLAAKIANDYIQLSNDSVTKKIIFDKRDFKGTSMIVSGIAEFSGAWSLPFQENRTILEDAYSGNGKVYIMRQWAKVRYSNIEQLGASVLELPYGKDEEYSMIIIRPEEGSTIPRVLKNFVKINFLEVILQLYSEGLKEIEVKLPKFSLTSSLLLNKPMMSMEINDLFSPERVSNMYVSDLEHKTVVMVAEAGTVATASTPGNLEKNTDTFGLGTAEPFLFFIVHGPSMSIIFSGKYGV